MSHNIQKVTDQGVVEREMMSGQTWTKIQAIETIALKQPQPFLSKLGEGMLKTLGSLNFHVYLLFSAFPETSSCIYCITCYSEQTEVPRREGHTISSCNVGLRLCR